MREFTQRLARYRRPLYWLPPKVGYYNCIFFGKKPGGSEWQIWVRVTDTGILRPFLELPGFMVAAAIHGGALHGLYKEARDANDNLSTSLIFERRTMQDLLVRVQPPPRKKGKR